MIYLSDNLIFLRKEKKLSRDEFADIFGLKRGNIESYELKGSQPRLEVLIAIANYFDITLDELVREDLQKKQILTEAESSYTPSPQKENEIKLLKEVLKTKDDIIYAKDQHIADMRAHLNRLERKKSKNQ